MHILLIPLLAALTQAASLIFHKIALAHRKIGMEHYVPLLFLFLTIYSTLLVPALGWINTEKVFQLAGLITIGGIIFCGLVWNYLYFKAIKSETVNVVENIMSLSPITTILIVGIVVPQSFDVRVGFAALVATLAMVWGYWHKHKIDLSPAAFLLILSVVFMASENILVGLLLQERYISPVTLFAMRAAVMFLVFLFYFKPDWKSFNRKNLPLIGIIGLIGTAMMLFRFYGLRDSGIVYTSLILILVPFLVFLASKVILHEKTWLKQIVTIIIVVLAVVYATLIQT